MKLSQPVKIDLLLFFLEGKFDCLEIGQSKEWILHNFPDPDDFASCDGGMMKSSIWRYGNIELHFAEEKLAMIFSDYVSCLEGGDSLKLEPWLLKPGAGLTFMDIVEELHTRCVDFRVSYKPTWQQVDILIDKSNVKLIFSQDETAMDDFYHFFAFCLS